MNRNPATILAALVAVFSLVACSATGIPIASLAPDVTVECGPIADRALCLKAAELAATAKINPPPIVDVRVRRPDPDDPCAEWIQPCGPDAIIVQIQSGDTIQEVPLVPSSGGWALLPEPGSG
jgi:hypothetical protein